MGAQRDRTDVRRSRRRCADRPPDSSRSCRSARRPSSSPILDNRVASWNPAAERLFGYTAEEAAGRNLDDLVATTEPLHAEAGEFRRRVAASEHVQTVTRRTRKDGTIVDVELSAEPIVADGEPVGTFAIYHDITELNRQRRFLEALLEVSPEAIVTTDSRTRSHPGTHPPSCCLAIRPRKPSGGTSTIWFLDGPNLVRRGKGSEPRCPGGPERPHADAANPKGRIDRRRRHRGRARGGRRRARREARLLSRRERAPAAEALARVRPEHQPDRDHHDG